MNPRDTTMWAFYGGHADRHADRQSDSSIPLKTFILRGYFNPICSLTEDNTSNSVLIAKYNIKFKISSMSIILTHSHTRTPFDASGKQSVLKNLGKGEIARSWYPTFSPFSRFSARQNSPFEETLICCLPTP